MVLLKFATASPCVPGLYLAVTVTVSQWCSLIVCASLGDYRPLVVMLVFILRVVFYLVCIVIDLPSVVEVVLFILYIGVVECVIVVIADYIVIVIAVDIGSIGAVILVSFLAVLLGKLGIVFLDIFTNVVFLDTWVKERPQDHQP